MSTEWTSEVGSVTVRLEEDGALTMRVDRTHHRTMSHLIDAGTGPGNPLRTWIRARNDILSGSEVRQRHSAEYDGVEP